VQITLILQTSKGDKGQSSLELPWESDEENRHADQCKAAACIHQNKNKLKKQGLLKQCI